MILLGLSPDYGKLSDGMDSSRPATCTHTRDAVGAAFKKCRLVWNIFFGQLKHLDDRDLRVANLRELQSRLWE
jgi:hypothetical protein